MTEYKVLHGWAVMWTVFEINNNQSNNLVAGLHVYKGFLHHSRCEQTRMPCWYQIMQNNGATVVGKGVLVGMSKTVRSMALVCILLGPLQGRQYHALHNKDASNQVQ